MQVCFTKEATRHLHSWQGTTETIISDAEDEADDEDDGSDSASSDEEHATDKSDDDDAEEDDSRAKREVSDEGESEEDEGTVNPEHKAKIKKHLSALIGTAPPRVIGPVEELISIANAHYNKEEFETAIRIYSRALHMIGNSGKFECHEDFVSCSLNLAESYLHTNNHDQANTVIQPVLLKVWDFISN